MDPHLTLILGGIASGKSAFAEARARISERSRRYIATAEAHDDEMRAKIARHIAARGQGWTTVEAPLDLFAALANATADEITLLDCATLWLTNHLIAESDLKAERAGLITALRSCKSDVIIVSNEVGLSGVADNALARRFQREQGTLNQELAVACDTVVTVTAGLPMVLKGTL